MADFDPPFANGGTRRAPTPDEVASGFPCGPADRELFHYLFHRLESEVGGLISKNGLTASDATFDQAVRGIRRHGMNIRTAGGTANALVVALDPVPADFAEIAHAPFWLLCSAVNTAAPTLDIGLGAKNITYPDGANLYQGELQPNKLIQVAYVTALDKFVMLSRSDGGASRASPLAGLYAVGPASFSVPSANSVSTKQTGYSSVVENLPNSSFNNTTGELTIGAGDEGYYLCSLTLNSNLALGSYGWSIGINVGAVTKIGLVVLATTVGPFGGFGGIGGIIYLAAGNVVSAGAAQNSGSAQNMSSTLSIVRMGA